VKKPKNYSQKTRDAWLKKRRWPFHIAVIHPTGLWRISCGIYDDHGEGKTLNEAIDDAIRNDRSKKNGCCRTSTVVTEIPEAKARQMLRAIHAMEAALTYDGHHKRCCP
jgi:hypothetical protein